MEKKEPFARRDRIKTEGKNNRIESASGGKQTLNKIHQRENQKPTGEKKTQRGHRGNVKGKRKRKKRRLILPFKKKKRGGGGGCPKKKERQPFRKNT